MSPARKVSPNEIEDLAISLDEIMYDEFGQAWVSNDPTVGVPSASEEEHDALECGLDNLTPKQRFVIECAWGLNGRANWDGPLSFRDIAALMGIHWTTVKEHYDAAMKKLRSLDTPTVSP